MKKEVLFLILLIAALLCISACGGDKTDPNPSDSMESATVGSGNDGIATGDPVTDESTSGADPSVIWTPIY